MWNRILVCSALAFATTLFAATAQAQVVIYPPATTVYSPVVPAPLPAPLPTTVYSPVLPDPVMQAPIMQAPVAAPGIVYPPYTAFYAPRRVVYRPYYARPVVVGYPPAAVVAGRPVIVRPKVYVSGQPIRNVLRAITP